MKYDVNIVEYEIQYELLKSKYNNFLSVGYLNYPTNMKQRNRKRGQDKITTNYHNLIFHLIWGFSQLVILFCNIILSLPSSTHQFWSTKGAFWVMKWYFRIKDNKFWSITLDSFICNGSLMWLILCSFVGQFAVAHHFDMLKFWCAF